MRKQIIKILLAINIVYVKVLEPLKTNNTAKVNERYDLKDKKIKKSLFE